MKRLHLICSYLIVALGVVHMLYTTQVYERFTLGAFWFVGAGAGLVYAGLLNLMFLRTRARDRAARALCLAGNAVATALFVVAIFLIGEPQVFLGTLLFACVTATTALGAGAHSDG